VGANWGGALCVTSPPGFAAQHVVHYLKQNLLMLALPTHFKRSFSIFNPPPSPFLKNDPKGANDRHPDFPLKTF